MKPTLLLTTSMLGAFIATLSANVNADTFHAHPSYCYYDQHASTASGEAGSSNYKLASVESDGDIVSGAWMCPMPDWTDMPDHSLNFLEVYVHDISATYYSTAKACRTFWDTNGGACGTQVNSGTTYASGHKTLFITDLDELAVTDDFGFISVQTQFDNYLKGYWGST